MTVLSTSARRPARPANRPPKPQPTIRRDAGQVPGGHRSACREFDVAHLPRHASASRAIHARMYGGQLRSAMPSPSHARRNRTMSRSTRTTSLRSSTSGPARRFRGEQRGEFAHVVGRESTAHGQHNVAIGLALDFQHDPRRARRTQSPGQRKMLNLNGVGGMVYWRDLANGEMLDNTRPS